MIVKTVPVVTHKDRIRLKCCTMQTQQPSMDGPRFSKKMLHLPRKRDVVDHVDPSANAGVSGVRPLNVPLKPRDSLVKGDMRSTKETNSP